jgi:hypothetical protein
VNRLGEALVCAVVGVTAAWAVVSAADTPAPPAPEPTPVTGQAPGGDALDDTGEEDLWWNCLTEGNLTCGPDWSPLTTAQRSELAELHDGLTTWEDGSDPWQGCLTDQVTVVCPDTYVYVWPSVTFTGGLV